MTQNPKFTEKHYMQSKKTEKTKNWRFQMPVGYGSDEYPVKEDNWEHRSERMRCKTCMFFVLKDPPTVGRCRINAPTLKGWPVMFPDDWCGEHRLDENKTQPVKPFEVFTEDEKNAMRKNRGRKSPSPGGTPSK